MGDKKLTFPQYILAGGVAGTCEILAMYPLDVVKTRLQLQTKLAPAEGAHYTGVYDAFRRIIKEEGFSKLYRGIASPIFAEAPKRAVKFATNEQYKSFFSYLTGGKLQVYHHVLSGSLAGMTEAFVNCPFEVVKVRMQAKDNLGLYKSTWDAAVATVRNEGALSLYKGLEPLLWRNGVWNGAYFGSIGFIKENVPKPDSSSGDTIRNFSAGVIGGTFATTLNTPFDVVKSRMQNVSQAGVSKWTLPSLALIAKEEGFKGLFKGYVPRILRLGPGGGIMFVAFEYVSKLIANF